MQCQDQVSYMLKEIAAEKDLNTISN